MSSSSSERLARFRASKRAAAEAEERRRRTWDAVTLAPVRRGLVGWLLEGGAGRGQQQQQQQQAAPDADGAAAVEDVDDDSESLPWTRLDAAILCVKALLWLSLFYLFVVLELGAAFVLTSGFAAIWLNLGTRRRGAASAYSVFNEDCRAIEGTITAEQFEREIRHGAGGMR